MKLTAKVTEVISGSESRDGQQQVKLKVAEADSMFKSLIVANADGLALDDELCLLVLRQSDAALAYDALSREERLTDSLRAVRDQLRPDEPPPFLSDNAETALKFAREFIADVEAVAAPQPDTADTLEFRLGGTV